MAMPVGSMIKHFRSEFEAHMEQARIAAGARAEELHVPLPSEVA
jgi:hypothetical protein